METSTKNIFLIFLLTMIGTMTLLGVYIFLFADPLLLANRAKQMREFKESTPAITTTAVTTTAIAPPTETTAAAPVDVPTVAPTESVVDRVSRVRQANPNSKVQIIEMDEDGNVVEDSSAKDKLLDRFKNIFQ